MQVGAHKPLYYIHAIYVYTSTYVHQQYDICVMYICIHMLDKQRSYYVTTIAQHDAMTAVSKQRAVVLKSFAQCMFVRFARNLL